MGRRRGRHHRPIGVPQRSSPAPELDFPTSTTPKAVPRATALRGASEGGLGRGRFTAGPADGISMAQVQVQLRNSTDHYQAGAGFTRGECRPRQGSTRRRGSASRITTPRRWKSSRR